MFNVRVQTIPNDADEVPTVLYYLGAVGVPDQDSVVLAAGEEQVAVVFAPGHAEHALLVTLQGLQGTRSQPKRMGKMPMKAQLREQVQINICGPVTGFESLTGSQQ